MSTQSANLLSIYQELAAKHARLAHAARYPELWQYYTEKTQYWTERATQLRRLQAMNSRPNSRFAA